MSLRDRIILEGNLHYCKDCMEVQFCGWYHSQATKEEKDEPHDITCFEPDRAGDKEAYLADEAYDRQKDRW